MSQPRPSFTRGGYSCPWKGWGRQPQKTKKNGYQRHHAGGGGGGNFGTKQNRHKKLLFFICEKARARALPRGELSLHPSKMSCVFACLKGLEETDTSYTHAIWHVPLPSCFLLPTLRSLEVTTQVWDGTALLCLVDWYQRIVRTEEKWWGIMHTNTHGSTCHLKAGSNRNRTDEYRRTYVLKTLIHCTD